MPYNHGSAARFPFSSMNTDLQCISRLRMTIAEKRGRMSVLTPGEGESGSDACRYLASGLSLRTLLSDVLLCGRVRGIFKQVGDRPVFTHGRVAKWRCCIWLSGFFAVSICPSGLSAAPGIRVVSPSTDVWTVSRDLVVDVRVTDPSPTYAFVDWESSLVGWWRGEGNTADSSVSGNAGTPGGNVTYAAGRFGQAFRFNGNDYVSVGDKEEFDFRRSDPFTLSVWVCRTDNDRSCIVNKYSNFYLYYNVAWRFQLGAEGAYRNLVASGASPQNVWFHLAVTYDAATQLLTMYIDGRAVDTADCAGIGEFSTTHPLQLGGGSWEGCRGLIDEFMLFNRALSQAEIGALYDAQANGLVGTFCDLMELVPYEYAVHAVNRAGEASSVSRTVTMDVPDSAPMGTVTSPRSPQRDRSSSQVFTGTAHDTNGDTTLALATLWWDVGQSPGTLISSGLADVLSGDSDTWSIAASGLRDATITWNIKLRDSAGHEGWIGPDNTLVIGPDTFYVAPAASNWNGEH